MTDELAAQEDYPSIMDRLPDSIERGLRERMLAYEGAKLAAAYETGSADIGELADSIAHQQSKLNGLTDLESSAAGLSEIAEAEGFWDTTVAAIKNIGDVASVAGTAVTYVAPTIAAGIGAGVVTGGIGGVAVGAADTALLAGGDAFLKALEEKGVDLTDPEAIKTAFQDENLMDGAVMKGAFNGAVYGGLTAASFGVAKGAATLGRVSQKVAAAGHLSENSARGAQATMVVTTGAAGQGGANAVAQRVVNGEVSAGMAVLAAAGGTAGAKMSRVMYGARETLKDAERSMASAGAPIGSNITLDDRRVISEQFTTMAAGAPEQVAPAAGVTAPQREIAVAHAGPQGMGLG